MNEIASGERKCGHIRLFIIVGACIWAGVLGYESHGTPILQSSTAKVVTVVVSQIKCNTDDRTYPRIVTCSNGKVYAIDDYGVSVGK